MVIGAMAVLNSSNSVCGQIGTRFSHQASGIGATVGRAVSGKSRPHISQLTAKVSRFSCFVMSSTKGPSACEPSELALPVSGGEERGEGAAGLLEGLEGGVRRRPIGALGDG